MDFHKYLNALATQVYANLFLGRKVVVDFYCGNQSEMQTLLAWIGKVQQLLEMHDHKYEKETNNWRKYCLLKESVKYITISFIYICNKLFN